MNGVRRIEKPPRPYLPPSAAGAVGAAAGAGWVLEMGWRGYTGQGPESVSTALATAAALASLGAALLLGALAARSLRPRACVGAGAPRSRCVTWVLWAAAGLVVGAGSGAVGVTGRLGAMDAISSVPASALTFRIDGDGVQTDYGMLYECTVLASGGARLGRARLSCDERIEPGVEASLIGQTSSLEDDAWGRSSYMAGVVAEVRAVRLVSSRAAATDPIMRARAAVLEAIDPAEDPARALVAGIVCGRTTELGASAASDAFARTGTSHLVAVSGSHLALVAALGNLVLGRMGAAPLVRGAVLAGLMGAYVAFTGGAPSALRSFCMVVLSLAATLSGRRGHGLSALALATMGLVALDAGIVFDLGFQLSALSVLFIQLFGRYLSYGIERLGAPRAVAEARALTLSAQWATLPLTIPVFGTCSLVAPLANLVLGPLMSALLVAGLALAPVAALVPALAPATVVAEWLARASIFIAELLGSFPAASVAVAPSDAYPAVLYGGAAVIYLLWPDVSRRHLCLAGVLLACAVGGHACYWARFAPPSITVMDVGQADAILIRDGASAALVDAGVDEQAAAALARNAVLRLDAVAITHWDRDHCGGLPDVLDAVPVDSLVVAEGAADGMPPEVAELPLPAMEEMRAGDELVVGGFTCEMVWPLEPVEGAENEDSLVLLVRYAQGARSLAMLLTGDAEAGEAHGFAPFVGDIDVLKLGHHGSRESVDAEVLRALDPELAIASAGEGNAYGHPSPECVGAVAAFGARFLCTKDAGDIVIEPGDDGVSVRTSHGRGAAGDGARGAPAARRIQLAAVCARSHATIDADGRVPACGRRREVFRKRLWEVDTHGRARPLARLPDRGAG